MGVSNGELVFVKAVKDGIPNRDPLADSDARRLFGEDDGRISLSDVSIKRDVRDYVQARFPDGGADRRNFVFVREERTADGKLLGRKGLAERTFAQAGLSKADLKNLTQREALLRHAFDVRVFGAVYSVGNEAFHLTGPVQFGWAHSLHPVETRYVQGTVVMPSQEQAAPKADGEEGKGKSQGTIWTTYVVPFAAFVMPGIINHTLAEMTGMDEADQELLLEGLWRGTLFRQARGRGIQEPLFLLHVEYSDPFFRIGYLEEQVRLHPRRDPPTALEEVELDLSRLDRVLADNRSRIRRARWWKGPVDLTGPLTEAEAAEPF
ncbi:CRISPR-associated protein Csd2 [Candidatus Hydrogenisulfobacillus filiaventi]|uniref:CRISPR-associated protein Csd2 n=1 Tax=Candidatus Hydrogenisulfobacillus filiaventi TaxID=2707344 RepID=A0A6F8ZC21_9FIRM|nr:type I CRISPR-associated protein Cas7 [Bacillota bacterium]CAB1127576.1 CRISPR-associated protein Csd2 [Candidatus Hydrogenisulfobacillus filiaventi]